VGRKEEGFRSNRLEPAAFVLALRGTLVTKHMLYLCDNQALLKAVKTWVGGTCGNKGKGRSARRR